MGVYDRDYMDGTTEAMHAGGRRYSAVVILLAINVAIWGLWQFANSNPGLKDFMDCNFTVSREGVLQRFRLHTLLTSCFSHEELMHILFNMLFFWILAVDVERIYGFRNMFWLYAFTGIVASLAYVGVEALRGSGAPALGASGAIMGIAVVAAIFDPRKPISIWGVLTIPLRLLVIIYIVFDILGGLGSGDHIAHSAHLGGAAAGFISWRLDLRVFASPGRNNVGLLFRLRRWLRPKPALRVVGRIPEASGEELPREAVAQARRSGSARAGGSAGQSAAGVDPTTSQRVDELLAKISRQGMGALNDEERAFLKEASRKYGK
jgi:membrane associated rhomboid family serine protease